MRKPEPGGIGRVALSVVLMLVSLRVLRLALKRLMLAIFTWFASGLAVLVSGYFFLSGAWRLMRWWSARRRPRGEAREAGAERDVLSTGSR